jgi:hypothetical protein
VITLSGQVETSCEGSSTSTAHPEPGQETQAIIVANIHIARCLLEYLGSILMVAHSKCAVLLPSP